MSLPQELQFTNDVSMNKESQWASRRQRTAMKSCYHRVEVEEAMKVSDELNQEALSLPARHCCSAVPQRSLSTHIPLGSNQAYDKPVSL